MTISSHDSEMPVSRSLHLLIDTSLIENYEI